MKWNMTESIRANLTYSVDTGVKPVNETMEQGNLERKYTGVFKEHAVTVHNGRPLRDKFVLDEHGFSFVVILLGSVIFMIPMS